MRLLNTQTFKLHSFEGDIPEYAILSHTWDDEEVTFQEIDRPERIGLKGWQKVVNCCRLAAQDGWRYVWIDTCCIDKTNSSELSEAINSMFRWYEEAQVCYAHLSDVLSIGATVSRPVFEAEFAASRWFTRGWTLQELLAPGFLLFVDAAWKKIGVRERFATQISKITGISTAHLVNFREACISTKMSWASQRRTTRVEDQSYSLLGLFDVNMPLLYGEGEKAFVRLQLELIKTSVDETIFAWSGIEYWHLLARSPEYYGGNYVSWPHDTNRRGFAMTNAGMTMDAEVWVGPDTKSYAVLLNVSLYDTENFYKSPLVLPLARETVGKDENTFKLNKEPFAWKPWNAPQFQDYRNLGRRNILVRHDYPDRSVPWIRQVAILHFSYPRDAVSVRCVDKYKPHWWTGRFDRVPELVHSTWRDKLQIEPFHVAVATVELSGAEGRAASGRSSQAFRVAIKPDKKHPIYGIWAWEEDGTEAAEGLGEIPAFFRKAPALIAPLSVRSMLFQKRISVEVHPRPDRPHHRPAVGSQGQRPEFQEFSLQITVEDDVLEAEHLDVEMAQLAVEPAEHAYSVVRLAPPTRRAPQFPLRQAELPMFSNRGEQV